MSQRAATLNNLKLQGTVLCQEEFSFKPGNPLRMMANSRPTNLMTEGQGSAANKMRHLIARFRRKKNLSSSKMICEVNWLKMEMLFLAQVIRF